MDANQNSVIYCFSLWEMHSILCFLYQLEEMMSECFKVWINSCKIDVKATNQGTFELLISHKSFSQPLSMNAGLKQEDLNAKVTNVDGHQVLNGCKRFTFDKYGDICPVCEVILCGFCGMNHLTFRCPARGQRCRLCKGMDHFVGRCNQKRL